MPRSSGDWSAGGSRASAPDLSFDSLFRHDPFMVLIGDRQRGLLSGLVGRIWTLRRDYPHLTDPEEFREWSSRGTARVLFANWVEPLAAGGAALRTEIRVHAIGGQARDRAHDSAAGDPRVSAADRQ